MKYFYIILGFIGLVFIPYEIKTPTVSASEKCEILSSVWSQSGDMPDGWFKEEERGVGIITKTRGCVGQELNFSIFEADTCGVADCDDALTGLYRRPFVVPTDNFTIRIGLGEEECEAGASLAIGYDCHLFFYLRNNGMDLMYDSKNKVGGDLFYECDGLCDKKATLLSIEKNGNVTTKVTVDPSKSNSIAKEAYNLLAPIGNLKCIDDGSGAGNSGCLKGGVGTYLNTIFNIAIGLAGALAVVMIVINSISYMGTESVFGKTDAKGKILSAIGGLLLALGAYAILNTINPALTGSEGLQIDQVVAEIDEDPITEDSPNLVVPSGAIARCPDGISKTQTKGGVFYVCNSLVARFKAMIDDAWAQGIKISGGGFRTKENQIALRTKNCGGSSNAFNQSATCNPQTALPGTSMHESGLAFDFKCEGKLINIGTGKKNRFTINPGTKKCFDWLSVNSSKYGLKNLPSENWHWSTTGK